jgi:hypothetical protein
VFFVAADVDRDGFQYLAELVDLGGQSGEGEHFPGWVPVLLDEFPQVAAPVEGGAGRGWCRLRPVRAATPAKVTGVPVRAMSVQASRTAMFEGPG